MFFFINYIFTILIYTISSGFYQFYAHMFYKFDNLNDWVREIYEKPSDIYDYIVVGAGTAGSIVAARLAEDPKLNVLVIEAGGQPSSVFDIPIVAPLLQLTPYDWQYKTEAQEHACWGLKEKKSLWPRGRVLGGTSRLNYMVYLRGHPLDFESWISDDGKHWTCDEILTYFKKSENQMGCYTNDSWHHTSTGPIPVSDLRHISELTDALLDAAVELGFKARQDLNGRSSGEGFMAMQANIERGARFSSDRLMQGKANIRVLTHSQVERVLLHQGYEAYGVRYLRHGKVFTVRARRTIILSAGSIGTPQILLLSGIGPKDHLQEHNIKVNVDLPVGENLQDHVISGIDLLIVNQSSPIGYKTMLNLKNPYDYLVNGNGPLTFPGCEVLGTIHSSLVKDPKNSPPDIQFMALPGGLATDGGVVLLKAMGVSDKLWQGYFKHLVGSSIVSILPTLLHPKSKGHVRLRSKNILDHPIINPKYLSHPDDIKIIIKGLETVVELAKTAAMKRINTRLHSRPLPGCDENAFGSAEYWECYVRHISGTAYHPVGTCRMGSKSSVVDHYLRVHNTSRLRIIDASIMPTLPSANINAAVMMIAEKGADMIKCYWRSQRLRCHYSELFLQSRKSKLC